MAMAQVERKELRKFNTEYLESTTDSSIAYMVIQLSIEQFPVVVIQPLSRTSYTNGHV